jgi:hypothetical protein
LHCDGLLYCALNLYLFPSAQRFIHIYCMLGNSVEAKNGGATLLVPLRLHGVPFNYTSYTLYSVFNATLHLQLRIPLFYFTTCFGHKGPSSGVLFAKTVALKIVAHKKFIYSHMCKCVICFMYTRFSVFLINAIYFLVQFQF